MNALVLGGTGFIGLNVCEALLRNGWTVRCGRRRSSNTLFARRLAVSLVSVDLMDIDGLTDAMRGVDVVFHCAAPYPRYAAERDRQVMEAAANVGAVCRAARAAGVSRVVFTGSVATVRRPDEGRVATEDDGEVDDALVARSTYFAMKRAAERAALEQNRDGLEVVVLLPTGCIGAYDYRVATGVFVAGVANRMLPVIVDGAINVVDAADVADAHVTAAIRGQGGRRYILGGTNASVASLVARVCAYTGAPLPQVLPLDDAVALADAEEARCVETGRGRPMLSRALVDIIAEGHAVSSARAVAELGYAARGIDEALDHALTWYRSHGFIKDRPSAVHVLGG